MVEVKSNRDESFQQILLEKREQILAIAEKHSAYNVRIFGSVARGEADDKSDIDLLVDYHSECRSAWFPLQLIRELETLLGCKITISNLLHFFKNL